MSPSKLWLLMAVACLLSSYTMASGEDDNIEDEGGNLLTETAGGDDGISPNDHIQGDGGDLLTETKNEELGQDLVNSDKSMQQQDKEATADFTVAEQTHSDQDMANPSALKSLDSLDGANANSGSFADAHQSIAIDKEEEDQNVHETLNNLDKTETVTDDSASKIASGVEKTKPKKSATLKKGKASSTTEKKTTPTQTNRFGGPKVHLLNPKTGHVFYELQGLDRKAVEEKVKNRLRKGYGRGGGNIPNSNVNGYASTAPAKAKSATSGHNEGKNSVPNQKPSAKAPKSSETVQALSGSKSKPTKTHKSIGDKLSSRTQGQSTSNSPQGQNPHNRAHAAHQNPTPSETKPPFFAGGKVLSTNSNVPAQKVVPRPQKVLSTIHRNQAVHQVSGTKPKQAEKETAPAPASVSKTPTKFVKKVGKASVNTGRL